MKCGGDAIAVESGEADRRWGLKVHKVSGRLHVRQQLEKIMNQTVIMKVFCGLDGEEVMHEEHAEGGF